MDLFQTICRICASQEELCDLTLELNLPVLHKLTSLTTIRIQENDLLPHCICLECVNKLAMAYEFLLRCEAAEQKLQDDLRKLQQQLMLHADDAEGGLETRLIVSVVEETEERDDGSPVPFEEAVLKLEGVDCLVDEETAILVEKPEEEKALEEVEDTQDLIFEEYDRLSSVAIVYEPVQVEDVDYEGYLGETIVERKLEEHYAGDDDLSDGIVEEHDSLDEIGEEIEMEELEMKPALGDYGDKKFFCETCGEGFEKCTMLHIHIKSHGNRRYKCDQCDRWFSRKTHLRGHEVIHTGERNYQCHSCPNTYTSSRNLRRHVKSAHLGEKPFVCDLCGKEFSQKTILETHHSTHVQDKNFDCEVCQKKFKSKKLLDLHLKRHLKVSMPKNSEPYDPVECDICQKVYSNKLSLRTHKQMHTDFKIECSFCGKHFKIMAHLKVHLRSHTKEQPYECAECHKKFGYESSLKTHMLTHTDARPYKCGTCDTTFRQLNHLKAHQLLHTGAKPFECAVCKKSFALRSNLTIHMRIHGDSEASPYQCRLCEGKKLNDSNAIKRHLKAHPSGKIIKIGALTVIVEGDEEEAESPGVNSVEDYFSKDDCQTVGKEKSV
ncbi:gastrula zinc finger protein XlCGF57.1-like [Uranotaenia lowii]|uniref:gastrula zinc finger protein XlCGF57.1-like n=1 Tax=Uranotaenia lowii TaxID=190385 RepID=UPI002478E1EB|nr:gastrula zinc finger protein XlCGF57.1-like [Uranotaenia lowii]